MKKTAVLISYIFHPLFVLPLFLLSVLDYVRVDNITITFIFLTALIITIVPSMRAKKIAKGKGIDIENISSPAEKAQLLIVSLLMFSIALILFEVGVLYYGESLKESFRLNLLLVLFFYIGVYFDALVGLFLYKMGWNISLHMIAWGSVSTFFYALIYMFGYVWFLPYLFVSLLISAIVASSRFMISNHKRWELYAGFFAGIVVMVITLYIMKVTFLTV
jgi:hypothetical protein